MRFLRILFHPSLHSKEGGVALPQRIILVNPCYQRSVQAIAQISIGPPLGLAYLAAVLEKEGYPVDIIDANAERLSNEEVIRRVLEFKAEVVGLTAVTPTLHLCCALAGEIKKLPRPISTVIGGAHTTSLPKETLQSHPEIDFLITGEGEFILPALLKALENKEGLANIRGLCWRESGNIILTAPAENIGDLNQLPFPSRHLLPNNLYRTPESGRMTSLIAMRGCPAQCIYCAAQVVAGRKLRKRSPENVLKEMELCFSAYGVRFFAFLDDTFTFDKSWVHDLCAKIIASGMNRRIRWSCLTRVDNVDLELLKHMKQAGCLKVEFGIESGSPEILALLKKNITVEQIKTAFGMAKQAGLSTFGFAMLNAPRETAETISLTKKLILQVDPDFLQLSFATPYPGTELFTLCKRDNLLKTEEWSEYIFLNHQVIKNRSMTEETLKQKMLNIQRSFYLRPGYIFRTFWYMLRHPKSLQTILWAEMNALNKLLFQK